MRWPSTETVVSALIAGLLLGGRLAELALSFFRKRTVDKAANSHRLVLLMTLVGLVLLLLTFLYFWVCDPAGDSLLDWFRGRQTDQSLS